MIRNRNVIEEVKTYLEELEWCIVKSNNYLFATKNIEHKEGDFTLVELGIEIKPFEKLKVESLSDICIVSPKNMEKFNESFIKDEKGAPIINEHKWKKSTSHSLKNLGYDEDAFCIHVKYTPKENYGLNLFLEKLHFNDDYDFIGWILANLINSYLIQFFNFQTTGIWEREITIKKPLNKSRWNDIENEFEIQYENRKK